MGLRWRIVREQIQQGRSEQHGLIRDSEIASPTGHPSAIQEAFLLQWRLYAGVLAISISISGPVFATPGFVLTPVRDVGGGGCIGETRVFLQVAAQRDLDDRRLNPSSRLLSTGVWKKRRGRQVDRDSFVVTTTGCGADAIAIGVNGKSYVLNQIHHMELGEPVVFVGADNPSGPSVQIEAKKILREDFFKGTDCRLLVRDVRITVEFNGQKRAFNGTSINSCP